MYDGDPVEDEVAQNARDQQHPVVQLPTQEIVKMPYVAPAIEFPQIPGLSQRQIDLIHNKDTGLAENGAARERRLQIIYRDITAINHFLPRMEEVRDYLTAMPTNDDEQLVEALGMADMRLKAFITEIKGKLASLEQELELKKVVV